MSSLQFIYKELGGLPKKDLQALQGRVNHLLNYTRTTTIPTSPLPEDLYQAIQTTLIPRQHSCLHWSLFQKQDSYAQFVERVNTLSLFFTAHTPTNKVERVAFYLFLIRLLVASLEEQHVPISSRALCTNIHRLPDMIDQAFPGYLESGLFPWVLSASALKE